ncbi:MAG: arylsulfatase [Bacteroidetes bacterium]|nr:MAG: arylsulfatase [Bacteroidota bacterium]
MPSLRLLLPLLLVFAACKPEPEAPPPPNVVIIFADDLGYGDLSCYGQTRYGTPNLDRMAQQGVRFTNFYVPHPVCSASRAALLTGSYANRLGVYGAFMPTAKVGLNPEEVTLAELLKTRGYATAIYGKWHLGHLPPFLPTRQGFDDYFGLPFSNDMWPKHPNQANFQFPELPLIQGEDTLRYITDNQDSLTVWYTQHAVDFIDQHTEQPFFLYLAHSMPHVPLYVSDRFRGKSGAGLYGDVIMEIDWSVGEVLAALERNGLTDNTLVIFTSDNGPWLSYGTHSGVTGGLREGKGTCFEGGVRVPFIAQWPGKIPAGITQPMPAMTIDVFPTVAHWAGVLLPEAPIDGRDIRPLLTGEAEVDYAHSAYAFYYEGNQLQGLLSGDGRWKRYFPHTYRSLEGRKGRSDGLPIPYNYDTEIGDALYDLRHDFSEVTDVAAEQPDIMARLDSLAEGFREELGDALQKRSGRGQRPVGRVEEP